MKTDNLVLFGLGSLAIFTFTVFAVKVYNADKQSQALFPKTEIPKTEIPKTEIPKTEVQHDDGSYAGVVNEIVLKDGTRCAVYVASNRGGITCDWNKK